MKKIKTILFVLFLCAFIALLVISLLLPDRFYQQLSEKLFSSDKDEKVEIASNYKAKRPQVPTPQANTKISKPKKPKPTFIEPDASIQVVSGFDWRLPSYAQRSNLSGLISETRGAEEYVRADFHMVRWDKTNPQQNKFDFSELEAQLRNRSQQQVLLRLETYGKCEAPDWALKQLEVTSRGTIIFWRDSYIRTLKPYVREIAKLVNQYPQIIGVQIGIADGQYRVDCSKFSQKDGWGEFNLKPDELKDAQNQYGLTPDLLESSTKRIIDMYADEFGGAASKLIFNNLDQFSWQNIAIPYNAKMPSIASYALSRGIGNRDGQVEHWMRYTNKIYGMQLKPSNNGTCSLDMNEQTAKQYANRYWGTEIEEFGDYYWVRDTYGGVNNQAHRFFASSLRALQMRRNYMTIHGEAMQKATDPVYKTQDFLRYLDKTLGKQPFDTPDAFILLGERYVANFRLTELPEHKECQSQGGSAIRSYGRWITEESDSKPAMRIDFPVNDKRWGQGFYLPRNVNYEYAARSGKKFSFNLNDELTRTRCSSGCNVEVKVSYKDDTVSNLWLETPDGSSGSLKTRGDNRIKTATFKLQSRFDGNTTKQDLLLKSDTAPLSVILLRINFLDP
jgi:hypothetical protein